MSCPKCSHHVGRSRTYLKAVLLLGFGAIQVLAAAPEVRAADLAVTPAKRAAVVRHERVRVVRDYDGTPIALRRAAPVVVRGHDGAAIVVRSPYFVAHPVERATPTRYLNGQPVWPTNRVVHWRR